MKYVFTVVNYRKIPKISPSMYKALQIWAPQSGNTTPPGGLYLKDSPQKKRKNAEFTSIYTASPIDFETQSSLFR